MSTAAIPAQQPSANSTASSSYNPASAGLVYGEHLPGDFSHSSASSNGLGIRRRSSFSQGRALEILGHAVEYLVDSRMFLVDQLSTHADAEAVQILMRLSRQVFAECAEVVPPARRLRLWIAERLDTPANC